MALTRAEEILTDMLMKIGADEDEIIGIMLLLRTQEEQEELALWLYRNPRSTPQETIRASLDIQAKKS